MNDRDEFILLLKQDPDNLEARLIYADWLDDNGYHEEAERQRDWQRSKDWMVQFCKENNPIDGEDDYYHYNMSYPRILDIGRDAAEDDYYMQCNNNEQMMKALEKNAVAFWHHWSVITGIPMSKELTRDDFFFGCSC